MTYRAVFFDVGETLVHPAPTFPDLFASILLREGYLCAPEDVVAASGVVMDRFSEAARDGELWTTSPERSRDFWLSVYERMLTALGLPGADGLGGTLYREFTDLRNYELFEDVRGTLGALTDAGLGLGIISNFEAWLEELLVALGVHEAFPVRVISGVEGIEKPDPQIFELAMARAGVSAEESVYVGDNPEFDVDPPAALGMFTVLIDRRDRHPHHGGARIADMRELPAVLGL
ncbi:MAG: HAD-IA family hydrolase [Actinomycetota bacterium]